MTRSFSGEELSLCLAGTFPDVVEKWDQAAAWVTVESIVEVCRFLRDDSELHFDFLSSISAVDYIDHFDVVYHLTSLNKQHTAIVKARLNGRDELSLPSVYHLWRGADFQEREIWDLMGIRFDGHPNLKRIMLWEGFEGHPLRKDYL